jgi:hypothetical protein
VQNDVSVTAQLPVLFALQAASSTEACSFVTRVNRRLFVLWHYAYLAWSVVCLLTWFVLGCVVPSLDWLALIYFGWSLDICLFPYLFIDCWMVVCASLLGNMFVRQRVR